MNLAFFNHTNLIACNGRSSCQGRHDAAEQAVHRAHKIVADHQKYRGVSNIGDDSSCVTLPRLVEWMGVQKFVAEEHEAAREFFARARTLVLRSAQKYPTHNRGGNGITIGEYNGKKDDGNEDSSVSKLGRRDRLQGKSGAETTRTVRGDLDTEGVGMAADVHCLNGQHGVVGEPLEEFHPEAMRLDLCAAVSICRQGPEAF